MVPGLVLPHARRLARDTPRLNMRGRYHRPVCRSGLGDRSLLLLRLTSRRHTAIAPLVIHDRRQDCAAARREDLDDSCALAADRRDPSETPPIRAGASGHRLAGRDRLRNLDDMRASATPRYDPQRRFPAIISKATQPSAYRSTESIAASRHLFGCHLLRVPSQRPVASAHRSPHAERHAWRSNPRRRGVVGSQIVGLTPVHDPWSARIQRARDSLKATSQQRHRAGAQQTHPQRLPFHERQV